MEGNYSLFENVLICYKEERATSHIEDGRFSRRQAPWKFQVCWGSDWTSWAWTCEFPDGTTAAQEAHRATSSTAKCALWLKLLSPCWSIGLAFYYHCTHTHTPTVGHCFPRLYVHVTTPMQQTHTECCDLAHVTSQAEDAVDRQRAGHFFPPCLRTPASLRGPACRHLLPWIPFITVTTTRWQVKTCRGQFARCKTR